MNVKSFAVICALCFSFLACTNKKQQESNLTPGNLLASEVAVGLEVGQRAPDMILSTPKGDSLSLSSLRGKVVLIDFWASWCMPCRIENPNLVKVYSRYDKKKFTRGNGFTIYSVSLDTNKDAWIKTIENDGLKWENHVSDFKGWYSQTVAMYKIEAIPANFLLDGDGIIIAKNLRASALGETMESLLR